MKRLFLVLLCLSLCICFSSCTSNARISESSNDYDRGYDDGYQLGYYTGYEDGTACDDESSDDDSDYQDGYNDGNYDGYYAGATYTCLFFGDVDRALRSAYKGSAWETFIDAYDQYISDIYENSETKSTLFWAFVSVKSGDGLTAEERDLLISTFGEDLFIKNNIELKVKSD